MLIHQAVQGNHFTKLQEILKRDASQINAIDRNGNTPLHIAIRWPLCDLPGKSSISLDINILFYLLSFPNIDVDTKNNAGHTALAFAVDFNYPNLFDHLRKISKKELSFHTDSIGNTLLHFAVYSNSLEMVQKVYTLYPQILNQTNQKGLTPLHCAGISEELVREEENHKKIISYLLAQPHIDPYLHPCALPCFLEGTDYEVFPNISSTVLMVLYHYKQKNISLDLTIFSVYLHALFNILNDFHSQDLHTSTIIFGKKAAEALLETNHMQMERIYKIIAYIYHCYPTVILFFNTCTQLKNELAPFLNHFILEDRKYDKVQKSLNLDKATEISEEAKELAIWFWLHWNSLQKSYIGSIWSLHRTVPKDQTIGFKTLPEELRYQILHYLIPEIMNTSEIQLLIPCSPKLKTEAFYGLLDGLTNLYGFSKKC